MYSNKINENNKILENLKVRLSLTKVDLVGEKNNSPAH